jgi:hypothetical protein
MASRSARFQVDSRLAKLLSQEYTSSERALKELVDNAWDADAEEVRITLPAPMSQAPIVVADNGTGMTRSELEQHYLYIAADRRSTRGDRTAIRHRLVKGRKGIGKFAGLMVASDMALETRARGSCARFVVRLGDLAKVEDIERLPIAIHQGECDPDVHGTIVMLTSLHTGLAFPDAKRLRQVLLQEYGRAGEFTVYVNDKPLGIDDVAGTYSSHLLAVPGVGEVKLEFAIAENRAVTRQPGLVIRVDGKTVGKPTMLGLDQQEDFPQKLLSKLHGEIDASGLREHVTADWGSVIENSELLQSVQEAILPKLREAFHEAYGREMQLAQARLQRAVKERLARVPEHRRAYAERAIQNILDKFYGEPTSKYEPFVFVLLEAMEHADYGSVLEHLAQAPRRDVAAVAEALNEFGLAELAFLVERVNARMTFLDGLEALAGESATLEATMHKAIEVNLWLLSPEFSVYASNKTLRRLAQQVGQTVAVEKGRDRPDLLLNANLEGDYLLIEFKRPSHGLKRADYIQATNYRHELLKTTTKRIRILVIGGSRDSDFPMQNREPDTEAWTYTDIVGAARRQLDWYLSTTQRD